MTSYIEMIQPSCVLWGLLLPNGCVSVSCAEDSVRMWMQMVGLSTLGGEKSWTDVRSIYQSVTMLWFFTPYSTVNQVFPILTTQCAEEGIHLFFSDGNNKHRTMCLWISVYDPFVFGLHVLLPSWIIKNELKNLTRKISFSVCCGL